MLNRLLKMGCLAGILCMTALSGWAKHIKGGEIHYEYLGPASANMDKYRIRLRLFVICDTVAGQVDDTAYFGIYDRGTNLSAGKFSAAISREHSQLISLTTPGPCISNPSPVCYLIIEYPMIVNLPRNASGYTVIFQRCCRLDGIRNLNPNVNVGASYTCTIPGTDVTLRTGQNSNPEFLIKDTVLICQNYPFQLDFGATDTEHDSLSYSFVPGYLGGTADQPVVANPSSPSSLRNVNYAAGFSGTQPLGPAVTVNPQTGLISGVAPRAGDYVVCVQLTEWRKGILLSSHRKDFIIHVDDKCKIPSAELNPNYITCDGYSYTFENLSPPSALVHSYTWNFGVPGILSDTSHAENPTYTFPQAGDYSVVLYVNKGELCSDSAVALVKIYPGFFTGFTADISCLSNPVYFQDTSKTAYGVISARAWDFGDAASSRDTATRLTAPSWKYADTGTKKVTLIVSSSKGCVDTVTNYIRVLYGPPIDMAFHDTLICTLDSLQLHATGNGQFTWTPAYNMNDPMIATPVVWPKQTTTYTATVEYKGCQADDTVRVRVVDHVTLDAGPDSTICATDTIAMRTESDGRRFAWTPAASVIDATEKNARVHPAVTTTYAVTASIGRCTATDRITIHAVPYPRVTVAPDTFICYHDTAQLYGTTDGSRWKWQPSASVERPASLRTPAFPETSTDYSLYAYDTLGCPKPAIATMRVTVDPPIPAFAGNDTSIVIGEPLQLHGSGGDSYRWSPPAFLSDPAIADPVASLPENMRYVMKASRTNGCFAYDTIFIKVFRTQPDIFVPNAFTPGGTVNQVFRPIPVGISRLLYFRIYNRNGMLIYETSRIGAGWDGTYMGTPQDTGGYVWTVEGVDYTGRHVTHKGTMVLVR